MCPRETCCARRSEVPHHAGTARRAPSWTGGVDARRPHHGDGGPSGRRRATPGPGDSSSTGAHGRSSRRSSSPTILDPDPHRPRRRPRGADAAGAQAGSRRVGVDLRGQLLGLVTASHQLDLRRLRRRGHRERRRPQRRDRAEAGLYERQTATAHRVVLRAAICSRSVNGPGRGTVTARCIKAIEDRQNKVAKAIPGWTRCHSMPGQVREARWNSPVDFPPVVDPDAVARPGLGRHDDGRPDPRWNRLAPGV